MMNNVRLYDLLTRQQLYVEGVKNGQQREFSKVLRKANVALLELFAQLEFDTMDALTKSALRKFLVSLRESQYKIYNEYSSTLIRNIREFMEVDLEITKAIYESESGLSIEEAQKEGNGAPLFALAWLAGGAGSDKLWTHIKNEPMPANGALMGAFVSHFANVSQVAVENIIKKARANRWTKDETLKAITGVKSNNYKGGLFSGINNNAGAVIDTITAHAAGIVSGGVSSVFVAKYVWDSIIDSATTDICRRRNQKVYVFGKGPLPPAHIRCRSGIRLYVGPVDLKLTEQTFYAWIKKQPSKIQNDVLSKATAEGLRSGALGAQDFKKFVSVKPLSIDEYKAKRGLILT